MRLPAGQQFQPTAARAVDPGGPAGALNPSTTPASLASRLPAGMLSGMGLRERDLDGLDMFGQPLAAESDVSNQGPGLIVIREDSRW